jgi:hypothetical protein
MMEPIEGPRCVLNVSTAEATPISGEIPVTPLRPAGAVRVRDMQLSDMKMSAAKASGVSLSSAANTAGFDNFYAATRVSVGRALALTLRDVDLATEAVDEALARAVQRWDRVEHLDNPAGWVYRVGLNYARSRVRRLSSRLPIPRSAVRSTHSQWIIGRWSCVGFCSVGPNSKRPLRSTRGPER